MVIILMSVPKEGGVRLSSAGEVNPYTTRGSKLITSNVTSWRSKNRSGVNDFIMVQDSASSSSILKYTSY